jgi:hypothetical protein
MHREVHHVRLKRKGAKLLALALGLSLVATAWGGDERQAEGESKELHALALESHVVDLLWHG